MKKLIFVTILLLLSGCGNPNSGISENGSALSQQPDASPEGLIKLDPAPEGNSSVGGFAPVVSPTQEVVDIINSSQQVIPQTVESEVTNSSTPVTNENSSNEVVNNPESNSMENSENQSPTTNSEVVEDISRQTSDIVESNQNTTEDQVVQTETQDKQSSNLPEEVVESRVLENVVYVAQPSQTSQENSSNQTVESTTLPVADENAVLDDSAPVSTQEMAQAVDSSVVESLNQINYSDATAENTTITYEKKNGKMETYYVYSQNPNSYDWTKELAVFVENGEVKLIQSLNQKELSLFNSELSEIVSMEKEFSKKVKSSEVSPMKETVAAYVVKSKKNKKVFKLPNKKFGKKKKHSHHN